MSSDSDKKAALMVELANKERLRDTAQKSLNTRKQFSQTLTPIITNTPRDNTFAESIKKLEKEIVGYNIEIQRLKAKLPQGGGVVKPTKLVKTKKPTKLVKTKPTKLVKTKKPTIVRKRK